MVDRQKREEFEKSEDLGKLCTCLSAEASGIGVEAILVSFQVLPSRTSTGKVVGFGDYILQSNHFTLTSSLHDTKIAEYNSTGNITHWTGGPSQPQTLI